MIAQGLQRQAFAGHQAEGNARGHRHPAAVPVQGHVRVQDVYKRQFLESFQEKGMTLITKDEIDIESFKEAIIPQLLEENKDVYPEGAYEQIQALNQ